MLEAVRTRASKARLRSRSTARAAATPAGRVQGIEPHRGPAAPGGADGAEWALRCAWGPVILIPCC